MSLISIAVQDLLKADSTVAGLVGYNRVYPDALPRVNDADPTMPAITVSVISDIPDEDQKCLRAARIQVSCWSNPTDYNGVKSPQEVETLAEAVISALHNTQLDYVNNLVTVSTKNYQIIGLQCVNMIRLREADTDYYHIPLDFMVYYRKQED